MKTLLNIIRDIIEKFIAYFGGLIIVVLLLLIAIPIFMFEFIHVRLTKQEETE